MNEADDLSGVVVAERYTIERAIGRGGMATVWRATDAPHARMVAIKTLHPDLTGAIGAERFLRELRLTARLQHPAIVPILDSGALTRPDGTTVPWYAMPYLDGETLRARLTREGRLPIEEALRITIAVGEALEAAHRQHVVHRDIKPENICLVGDRVYVVDFGIGKALGAADAERLTSTGLTIGTPAYMSPEQSVGEPVDARSDQYSLATVLYEMLAGELPFSGPSTQAVIARRIAEPARPLATVRSTVPPWLERATLRALERTPADRFPDIADFLRVLRGPDAAPRPTSHSRRLRVAAVLGALLAVGALAGWTLLRRDRPPRVHVVPADVLAMYQQASRAYERRTPEGVVEAITTLREAHRRDSTFASSWSLLAQAYARAFQRGFRVPDVPHDRLLQLAISAFDRSLVLDPNSADVWMSQAILSFQVDPVNVAAPLRSIRKAIALDSMQGPAWHYLALFLASSGDLDAAIDAWRRSVRLSPSYAQGVGFLAWAHYWRWNFDSAAVWADSALALEPNYLLALQIAANVAVERGDFVRAEASFEAARRVTTDVEVVNSLAGLALAKARKGDRTGARFVLQQAESLAAAHEPLPAHTPIFLAQAYAALGDRDRSLTAIGRYQPVNDAHFQLHLRCDPPFAPLAGDPRFRALVSRPPPVWGKGC